MTQFNLNLIPEPRNEICGNYKKEKDEECDPGGIVPQDSVCCTKECKLKPKALCRYIIKYCIGSPHNLNVMGELLWFPP